MRQRNKRPQPSKTQTVISAGSMGTEETIGGIADAAAQDGEGEIANIGVEVVEDTEGIETIETRTIITKTTKCM